MYLGNSTWEDLVDGAAEDEAAPQAGDELLLGGLHRQAERPQQALQPARRLGPPACCGRNNKNKGWRCPPISQERYKNANLSPRKIMEITCILSGTKVLKNLKQRSKICWKSQQNPHQDSIQNPVLARAISGFKQKRLISRTNELRICIPRNKDWNRGKEREREPHQLLPLFSMRSARL